MAEVCREIQEWIEEQVEQPIETFVGQFQQVCDEQDCNWWCLCCNKWFCWLTWLIVRIVTWVVITIGKWLTRIVCEVINATLDIVASLINLLLSIPIIGGIVRSILNWWTEIFWRLAGLLDFVASLVGIRLEKRIYVGVVILRQNGDPIATEANILPQIERAKELYKRLCNVKIVYSGACTAALTAPRSALTVGCDEGGYFNDWWIGGSYIELATAQCKPSGGWRRVIGYGAEIIVVVVADVVPGGKTGCSFASTHNYVVVEPGAHVNVVAHEIGHACLLPHDSDSRNLMDQFSAAATTDPPTLTSLQIAMVRWSKHCVYF